MLGCAAKAGLVQMTKTLSIHWGKQNLRVNAVAAGLTKSAMTAWFMDDHEMLAPTLQRTPLDRILVETDAPYLTPQVVRKERNRPAYVAHTARFIAELRNIEYSELEAAVDANAATLFGW